MLCHVGCTREIGGEIVQYRVRPSGRGSIRNSHLNETHLRTDREFVVGATRPLREMPLGSIWRIALKASVGVCHGRRIKIPDLGQHGPDPTLRRDFGVIDIQRGHVRVKGLAAPAAVPGVCHAQDGGAKHRVGHRRARRGQGRRSRLWMHSVVGEKRPTVHGHQQQ